MYPYTADLLCLDMARPLTCEPSLSLDRVTTPLIAPQWQRALSHHPDRAFARYILKGLTEGFRTGHRRANPLRSATGNMPSASQHPEVIDEYLRSELSLGRMLGPFSLDQVPPHTHVNRMGLTPKGHNTGKWRLITDLSYPRGASVNDGIDPRLCSLSYTSVDDVARRVSAMGIGTLMAKTDIASAYRIIPVHPEDRVLQAIQWRGSTYIDPMLPFGLRSAPKIFSAVADAFAWHLHQIGIPDVDHYLDDFIVLGPPLSPLCQQYLHQLQTECSLLGIPLAAHKTEGPTTCLTFLGIEIDSVAARLRLPADKLERLTLLLHEWAFKRSCLQKELESLIGLLNHACKVIRPGRSFLRRMLDLLHATCHPPRGVVPIRLNKGFQSDLAWWLTFTEAWNGTFLLATPFHMPHATMTSDASGSWGCGAWYLRSWFQITWDYRSSALTIAEKEFLPIILACATWGRSWHGHRVTCRCDNQVVVASLRSRTSRSGGIMHLLRCLTFVEAHYHMHIDSIYIDTHSNHLADDLSRNRLSSFLLKVPHADTFPSQVSLPLMDLLLDQQADWTSRVWRTQFSSIFSRD